MSLGGILKKLRRERGLRLIEVAGYTGVSYQYINLLENGRRDNPSLRVLTTLADFYDVSLEELLLEASSGEEAGYGVQGSEGQPAANERGDRFPTQELRLAFRRCRQMEDEDWERVLAVIAEIEGRMESG